MIYILFSLYYGYGVSHFVTVEMFPTATRPTNGREERPDARVIVVVRHFCATTDRGYAHSGPRLPV